MLPPFIVRAMVGGTLLFLLPGCAELFYERTGTGTFKGRLDVEWIEPNQFIYRPHADDPLTYTTSDGFVIRPESMYTDGGSIPRLFWSTPLLGPWDFAPGYVIHDWLFYQHHCRKPGWEQVDFPRSAGILAEAIKTQMERSKTIDPTIDWAIYEAVRSPAARTLWDEGACHPPPAEATVSATGKPSKPVRILSIAF